MVSRRKRIPTIVKACLPKECEVCGLTEGLLAHHIDWNPNNNVPENLQTLCKYCSSLVHKMGIGDFETLVERVNFSVDYKTKLRETAKKFVDRIDKQKES